MAITLEHIKEEDVRTLLRHPDPEKRAQAGQRICYKVRGAELSSGERKFAHKLLDLMSQDAVAIVRRTLSVTLRNSPELPRDVALRLAADIDNIAVPVLLNSPVLTDEDLVDVLRSKAAAKVAAIAKRAKVSGTIVREIVRYGDSHAVAQVAANDGAIIDEKLAIDKTIDTVAHVGQRLGVLNINQQQRPVYADMHNAPLPGTRERNGDLLLPVRVIKLKDPAGLGVRSGRVEVI